MGVSRKLRKILDGDFGETDLEEDSPLRRMISRIYGDEKLEELADGTGEVSSIELLNGPVSERVSLPEFVPELEEKKALTVSEPNQRGRRRVFILSLGLMSLLGTLFNIFIGMGKILCSIGIAENPHICSPSNGNTKLSIANGHTLEMIYSMEAWRQPLQIDYADVSLVIASIIISIIGLTRKSSTS